MVQPGVRHGGVAHDPARAPPPRTDGDRTVPPRRGPRRAHSPRLAASGIAKLASEFGVPGHAEPVEATRLLDRIATGPVIISVTEQFPTDGRRGGHLVVARGFDDSPDPMIAFRDPSAWGQNNQEVPLSRLTKLLHRPGDHVHHSAARAGAA